MCKFVHFYIPLSVHLYFIIYIIVHVNNHGVIESLPLEHLWICENIRMINPNFTVGSYIPPISGVVRQYIRENGTWDYTIVPDFAMK